MILIDTNVVLAAQRSDHPDHHVGRPWFERLVDGTEQFGIPSTVWASYLRVTTNRRIFTVPTPLRDAFAFVEATRARAAHVTCEPGPRHVELLAQVCDNGDAAGDLIPDAVIAAIALENGASVASFDRDFARFDDIDWIRPDT